MLCLSKRLKYRLYPRLPRPFWAPSTTPLLHRCSHRLTYHAVSLRADQAPWGTPRKFQEGRALGILFVVLGHRRAREAGRTAGLHPCPVQPSLHQPSHWHLSQLSFSSAVLLSLPSTPAAPCHLRCACRQRPPPTSFCPVCLPFYLCLHSPSTRASLSYRRAREPCLPLQIIFKHVTSLLPGKPQVFRNNVCLVHWCPHSTCPVWALNKYLVIESMSFRVWISIYSEW